MENPSVIPSQALYAYTRLCVALLWSLSFVSGQKLSIIHILHGYFTGTGPSYDGPSASETTLKNKGKTEINILKIYIYIYLNIHDISEYQLSLILGVRSRDAVALTQKTDSLQWRHNELDGVSHHWRIGSLLSRLFRRRSKKTSKLRVTGLCEENSPVTG